ncbi:HET-domain-containing protein [Hypoxylon trugodes]|uniref:HET-domain-containing protein n=1 Tax=Hypoxylon trugodes TaxID=326681 RepID=UPI00218DF764|nr:HET-domain-containing protein [Hypoxylon trugodes]KAI1384144.1 HET-domain-containing protein [Hypoxylon trugodes]
MRLLNAHTLKLVEFAGRDVPEYAILSHTWGQEEVTFEDLSTGAGGIDIRNKLGYAKIEGCRRQTLEGRYEWFWVDTCCINKSSSAELSEALNSMYTWYHRAAVCYAYISDVAGSPEDDEVLGSRDLAFRQSRWFTRGWTLQELLAPRLIFFYDASWTFIDDRLGLSNIISDITGIGIDCIRDPHIHTPSASTALKLSWASRWETLREEDMAYCLMGLLGVNMPLLYGEGGVRAFQRLQSEIMKDHYDHTILAWGLKTRRTPLRYWFGHMPLLASSPAFFSGWDALVEPIPPESTHYVATNLGLLIQLPITFLDTQEEIALGLLECCGKSGGKRVALPLTVKSRPNAAPLGTRCRGISPFMVPQELTACSTTRLTTLYLRNAEINETSNSNFHDTIDWRRLDEKGYKLADYFPPNKFHPAYPYCGFFSSGDNVDLLLRFRHNSLADLLLLYCRDAIGLPKDSSVRIFRGYAVLATTSSNPSHPVTSWELLLRPDFHNIDFEQLKTSFQWNSTISVALNNTDKIHDSSNHILSPPSSKNNLQFVLKRVPGEEGASILLVDSVVP